MKIVKTASGKKDKIKMSKKEWSDLGKKAGWTKTAAVAIPAGQFEITVFQQNDARSMGSSMVAGLRLHYKGETWELQDGSDLNNLVQDLSDVFASEIQQASGTQNQGVAGNQANLGIS